MFELRLRQIASNASLNVHTVDNRHALLMFKARSGRSQPLYVIPYDDVWEFSVPSAIKAGGPGEFPQVILGSLLAKNAKNKRAFWCIEQINGQCVLSAMLNFPNANLTGAEFGNICRALVTEVDNLESMFLAL